MEDQLPEHSVKKSKAMTEEKAKGKAMEALKTFESNLESDHTESHYVFRKIRG